MPPSSLSPVPEDSLPPLSPPRPFSSPRAANSDPSLPRRMSGSPLHTPPSTSYYNAQPNSNSRPTPKRPLSLPDARQLLMDNKQAPVQPIPTEYYDPRSSWRLSGVGLDGSAPGLEAAFSEGFRGSTSLRSSEHFFPPLQPGTVTVASSLSEDLNGERLPWYRRRFMLIFYFLGVCIVIGVVAAVSIVFS